MMLSLQQRLIWIFLGLVLFTWLTSAWLIRATRAAIQQDRPARDLQGFSGRSGAIFIGFCGPRAGRLAAMANSGGGCQALENLFDFLL